jgi:uncharacterized delta-60 repeat protein
VDSSYGQDGLVVEPKAPSVAYRLLRSRGGILVAGSVVESGTNRFLVTRYLDDGTPDPEFGQGGSVTASIGGNYDYAYDAVVDKQGRILLTGYAQMGSRVRLALARFTETGELEETFSTDAGQDNATGRAVALDVHGRILIGGAAGPNGNSAFALFRFDP